MTDDITTTVTWDDLIDAQADELEELREQYEEVVELAEEQFGEGALSKLSPDHPGDVDDPDVRERVALAQQARMLDRGGRQLQNRINMLEKLRDELGEGHFRIKMLSGREVMDAELELRGELHGDEPTEQTLQQKRNHLTVDAATVDAPEGIPHEDGDPVPSNAPNALVDSLFEQVQRFNSAGDADFRAEGFGSASLADSPASTSSAPPNDSATPSTPSVPTENSTDDSGEDS